MNAHDFLEQFIPAYEEGDLETLHHLRRQIFKETMAIVKQGGYTADAAAVTLKEWLTKPARQHTADGTAVILPDPAPMMIESRLYTIAKPANLPERPQPTAIEVISCDSLLAGKKLTEEGYHPAVLNFANRQTAGGGVLHGAGAQEENIFRRSNLACSLYQFHPDGSAFGIPPRAEHYPLDRNTGGIYTPGVTVFRDTEIQGYALLAKPYRLSIITAAAMNRPELKDRDHIADHLVEPVRKKMRTVFRIALNHGHDALVLGAWGCGAFQNPPQHIAALFHQVLTEPEFRNRFRKIIFAIVDRPMLETGPGKCGNLPFFQAEFARCAGGNNGAQHRQEELFRRFKGMFWGLIAGDCLGSPIQFSGKDTHPYITEMVPCPVFHVPAGYWTDDSAMALCIAESLVRLRQYDLADIANNFVRWYRDGFCSSTDEAFDVGNATASACIALAQGQGLRHGNETSQGNGSIMRLAPAYIWNYGAADDRMLHEISDLTHASAKVRATVSLMARICDEHLAGRRTGEKSIYRNREEVNNSGWAVSTLQAALWAFENTTSFADGLIAAVNLGGDSDSIGAVYGQIAGAYYGFDAIPERWLAAIKDYHRLNRLIEELIRLKLEQ